MTSLGWMDLQLARLAFWGAASGALCMALYGVLSPQRRLAALRARLGRTQARLDRFDGEFRQAMPLLGRMLRLALQQLALVIVPAALGLAPMVLLIGWLGLQYGYDFPASGEEIPVRTEPEDMPGHWVEAPPETNARALVVLTDPQGQPVGEIEVRHPVPVLDKHRHLAEGGAAPLPADAPVDRVEIDLPAREYLSFGPSWMRGWAFVFFAALTVAALSVKRVFRIL